MSDQAARQAGLREMSISQRVAAAVALRQLGYKVVARPSGVVVAAIGEGSHAVGKLEPSDVIVSVGGAPTPTIAELRAQLAKSKPGDNVTLGILRGDQKVTLRVKTTADPLDKHRAIVGFAPEQAAKITLPIKVQIDAGNVGGPSAGLMFSLGIYDKVTNGALTGGQNIAGTGTIDSSGKVGPIGGIRQKLVGAQQGGATYFLAPADNCTEVRGAVPDGLQAIRIATFDDARAAVEKIAAGDPKGLPVC